MLIGNQATGAQSEWRQGWALVLASSIGFSFFSVMLSGAGDPPA